MQAQQSTSANAAAAIVLDDEEEEALGAAPTSKLEVKKFLTKIGNI